MLMVRNSPKPPEKQNKQKTVALETILWNFAVKAYTLLPNGVFIVSVYFLKTKKGPSGSYL